MRPILKRWPNDFPTATVGELIARLQEFPADMLVAYTWESQVRPVVPEFMEVKEDHWACLEPVLLMDAET